MAAASSDLVALRYVPEVTFGTTPTTPQLDPIRFLSESLNYNIQNTTSNEIRPDRNQTDLLQTSTDSSGDISFELTYDSFDDFIEASMCGTWTANVLKNGTTYRSFTIQKHFTDIAQFHNFTGARLNTMALNIGVGQIVNGSFGVMAKGMSQAIAQIAGATTPAANANTPFTASANVSSLKVDSVSFTGCINSMSLNVNNNLRPVDCVGSSTHKDILLGKFEITGNIEIYFEDDTMYSKFRTGTDISLELTLTSAENDAYTILLPKVKFETGSVVAGGTNTDVMFSGTYRALYDSVETAMIKVTRVPHV